MKELSKWQKELLIFGDIKTFIVIEGNIYDIYCKKLENGKSYCELDEYLDNHLREQGYKNIVFFDPLHGFYNRFHEDDLKIIFTKDNFSLNNIRQSENEYLGKIYCCEDNNPQSVIVWGGNIINTMMTSNTLVAFVLLFGSRYCETPDNLMPEEKFTFLNLLYGSLNAHKIFSEGTMKKSSIFMVVDKINDIPSWFFINNPYFKNITIPLPDNDGRKDFIKYIEDDLIGMEYDNTKVPKDESNDELIKKLEHITEGMRCVEINSLISLCKKGDLLVNSVDDAVTLYKYGIKENPWESIPQELLLNANKKIKERVKGQDSAITRAVDVIKRAASGMSGLQHSSAKSRPRGIMFFAGPTGVGKTELAKSIAELLFNNEANCIRFDMSEYAQPQADQKLFGAPPGYVGYEAGGQLTNAVRQKPFSILLFDEIEKAHPSIWDKFLQVLDDGRMTDGQGNTVYFSETIIIFTSNLGIYVNDMQGNKIKNVSPEDSYEELEVKVTAGIKDYFNSQQGKPEILNRIGNNIIVFKYISKDSAREILEKQIDGVKKYMLNEKGLAVDFDLIIDDLLDVAMGNIENGGRGIGNIVEEYIINPLARIVYDDENLINKHIVVNGFSKNGGVVNLTYME
ncbi:MAG: AAA family ATPase [Clostridium sp.]|nr:AAA family ATPase [Clostridium sp.]MCM1207305.1 AAA family ATPase [Ruminococcus sp.]